MSLIGRAHAFLRRRQQLQEIISHAWTVLSPKFLYYSSHLLIIVNVVVRGRVKSKKSSFLVAVGISETRLLM